jgi:hypothetical protein
LPAETVTHPIFNATGVTLDDCKFELPDGKPGLITAK